MHLFLGMVIKYVCKCLSFCKFVCPSLEQNFQRITCTFNKIWSNTKTKGIIVIFTNLKWSWLEDEVQDPFDSWYSGWQMHLPMQKLFGTKHSWSFSQISWRLMLGWHFYKNNLKIIYVKRKSKWKSYIINGMEVFPAAASWVEANWVRNIDGALLVNFAIFFELRGDWYALLAAGYVTGLALASVVAAGVF